VSGEVKRDGVRLEAASILDSVSPDGQVHLPALVTFKSKIHTVTAIALIHTVKY